MIEHTVVLLAAMFSQVGARQLVFQWTDVQKRLITHPITQGMILFAMFFFSTRSAVWATAILLLYYLFTMVLINEKHPWNVIPKDWLKTEGFFENEASPTELYYENIKRLP